MELETLLKSLNENITGLKDSMTAQVKAQDQRLTVLEQQIKETLVQKYGPDGKPPANKQWSWARIGLAVATKDWSYAKFEREEIDKYRDEVMKTQTTAFTAGGALIPPQYVGELIAYLRGMLVLERAGARVLTGLQGSPVIFPKQTGGLTAYWVHPDGNAPTASDVAVGQISMQPRKLAALCKLSNDARLLTQPGIESLVRADIVNAMREALDKAAFKGTGLLGQPLGLDNKVPALATVSYTNTNIGTKMASLKGMVKALEVANALFGRLAFVMNPVAYYAIHGWVSETEKLPIFYNVFSGATANLSQTDMAPPPGGEGLIGYPVFRTTNLTNSTTGDIYFANWDDLLVGIWSDMELAASDVTSTAFQNDELWIRAILRCDFGIRRDLSFVKMTSVDA